MAIFTFTTDLGTADYFVAALKGRIVSTMPNANIIDISNNVPKFDHLKAAYIVKSASQFFPPNTIHIVGVNNYKANENKLLVAKYLNQYFVSYDTGFFSLLIDELDKAELFEIPVSTKFINNLIPLNELIDVALKIAENIPLQTFATRVTSFKTQLVWKPLMQENAINGNVIYIDSFDNLITNISQDTLSNYLHFNSFEIQLHLRKNVIRYISKSYADVAPGELVALFNYTGMLEIAINQGQAARLLGLKVGEKINIDFK